MFSRYTELSDMEVISLQFADGMHVTAGESIASADYEEIIRKVDGLDAAVAGLAGSTSAAQRASAAEFILEGLHINQLLNKDRVGGRSTYRG